MDDLAQRIKELPPAEQLRLAADLLDSRQPKVALQIVAKVNAELQALNDAGMLG